MLRETWQDSRWERGADFWVGRGPSLRKTHLQELQDAREGIRPARFPVCDISPVLVGSRDSLQVTFLAAAYKTLGIAFQLFPAFTDTPSFRRRDGMIERGFGDTAQEPGELINNFAHFLYN